MPYGVYIRTEKTRRNISKAQKISINSGRFMSGENHRGWKGGIRKYSTSSKYLKRWRHSVGISKKYNDGTGISYTKEYKKIVKQKYKALKRKGGELSIKTIQQVYEDNIKLYGTLTCYLCLQPIKFGQDSLEHKIPLSRGGTNARENLAIAHRSCNCKKNTKTEEEYRKGVLKQ